MAQQKISESEKQIIQQIESLVNAELLNLPSHLKDWAERHLITPRQMAFALKDDGTGEITLWLVTDDTGNRDSSSRIVFDEIKGKFGLVMSLKNGVKWFIGIYGGFAETINAM